MRVCNVGSAEREFDLWITYYGDQPGRYREFAEYTSSGPVSSTISGRISLHIQVFERYESILVADDDRTSRWPPEPAVCDPRQYDPGLQPAFNPLGKSPPSAAPSGALLRYTNFVEVTCPLFRTDLLRRVLEAHDPQLWRRR
ncbi:MAG: hypothetical protein R3E84_23910 [Pseudomonadales bacterium]